MRLAFSPVALAGALFVAGAAVALAGLAMAHAGLGQTMTVGGLAGELPGVVLGRLPASLDAADPPTLLALACLLLPVLAAVLLAAIAWTFLSAPLRLRLMRARGEHIVIAGEGALARLAADHAAQGEGAVLLWRQRGRHHRRAVLLVAGDPATDAPQLGLAKARSVLLLDDAGAANAARATQVMAQAARERPAGDPLAVIARIDDAALRTEVEVEVAGVSHAIARLRFAALPDLAARRLFLEWPLDRFRRAGQPARLVIAFGFSPAIESYLVRILAGSHFRDGVRPRFVIAVDDAEAARSGFHARHPGADTLSPVVFEEAGTAPFADLVARYGDPVAVLIDTGDDERHDFGEAAAIDAHYCAVDRTSPPLHVHIEGESPRYPMLHPFGRLADFAEPDLLIQERHDALARSIHDFYLEGRLAEGDRIGARGSMREWDDLSEGFRDDNRLVADCYRLKLRDIGARVIGDGGPPLRLEPAELEELARAEHDRWMAAKLSGGWVHGAERDDSRRRHPDIVPYDALSERIKDLDREQVRVMTRLLAATGARPLRLLTVAIEPGAGAGLARGIAGLRAEIARHWPDRVVMLSGALDDDAARPVLAAAAGMVRLIVAGHAGRLLASLSGAARAEAEALLHGADSIVAVPANDATAARAEVRAGADLLVCAAPPADGGCPVVVLAPDGRIEAAPWLR